jgi:putative flippase GtrA
MKLGVHYLVATALAVEIALLHNYAWHRRWTWADRNPRSGRLLRFHLANGVVSLLSNLLWMRVLTGGLGVPAVPANLAAITVTSLLNFALGERWVFNRSAERARGGLESLL